MQDKAIVRQMFFSTFRVTAIMMLTTMLGTTVDGIVTGQFLGADAVTATGLLNPITMVFSMVGTVLGSGTSLLCSRYLGMADPDRMNRTFSTSVSFMAVSAVVFSILMYVLSPTLATAVGASGENEVLKPLIVDYFHGYAPVLLAQWLSVGLSSLMQLDSDAKRAMLSTLVSTSLNITGDLLNVKVFHGGMFGMSLATTLSTYAGAVVLLLHFRKKDRVLHYVRSSVDLRELKDIVPSGLSSAVNQGAIVLRSLCINALLLRIATKSSVAAMTVSQNLVTLFIAMSLGVLISTANVSSVFAGERDRGNIEKLASVSLRAALTIGAAAYIAFFVAAPFFVRMFLSSAEAEISNEAASCLRVQALTLVFTLPAYSITGIYQGTDRKWRSYLISALREGVFAILLAIPLGFAFGEVGVWCAFPLSSLTALVALYLMAWKENGAAPKRLSDLLLLSAEYDADPDRVLDIMVHSMDEVMNASEEIRLMCSRQGASRRVKTFLPLAMEEMAGNIVQYGFDDGKPHSVDVRLVRLQEGWSLRLRDNCKPFDPVDWLKRNNSDDPTKGIGIRMILSVAKDVRYIPLMQLNNLIIEL